MISVGSGSSWIQGDAVCLTCGHIAELVGVPKVESGPHEICTSACRQVLEKLCVRNDFLTKKVKELQDKVENSSLRVPTSANTTKDIKAGTDVFSYKPPSAAVQTAPLRTPTSHTTTSVQTEEYKVGDSVLVRERHSESWKQGIVTKAEPHSAPTVRVSGLGEMTWGLVTSMRAPSKSTTRSTSSTPKMESKLIPKICGIDLLEPSEMKDMITTLAELKSKVERLQSENTRITKQLNTMTTEKAELNNTVSHAESKKKTLEYLLEVQRRQNEELAQKATETASLKATNTKLEAQLESSERQIEATLQTEIGWSYTMNDVVMRIFNAMKSANLSLEMRKVAVASTPTEFSNWFLDGSKQLQKLARPLTGPPVRNLRRKQSKFSR